MLLYLVGSKSIVCHKWKKSTEIFSQYVYAFSSTQNLCEFYLATFDRANITSELLIPYENWAVIYQGIYIASQLQLLMS